MLRSALIIFAALHVAAIPATQLSLEDFEFADSNPNAIANTTDVSGAGQTASALSGSGTNRTENTYALGVTVNFDGAPFGFSGLQRDVASPIALASPLTPASVVNVEARLDVKGATSLAAGAGGTSIFLRLLDAADDDVAEFYNITESALTAASFTRGLRVGALGNSRIVHDGPVFDDSITALRAIQIVLEDADGDASSGTIYVDNLRLRQLGDGFAGLVEPFEFANTDPGAQAGVFTGGFGATLTASSGAGANANQGLYAIGATPSFTGTAFTFAYFDRPVFPNPNFGQFYGDPINAPPGTANAAGLTLTLDVKGAAAFATGTNRANLFVQVFDADDDDDFRFIAFGAPALSNPAWTGNVTIPYFDDNPFNTSVNRDFRIQNIDTVRVLIEEPDADTYTAAAYFDNLQLAEPNAVPLSLLKYRVPLITTAQAPNVTDTTFDAIYSNGGAHPVITGGQWKDWFQRTTDPFAPISDNLPLGPNIASTSRAHMISDGVNVYFGMIVYDSNTTLMTADTGDDTLTKFNVEDVELALSDQPGTLGAANAYKFAVDSANHIDDMYPDGTTNLDSPALAQHRSYIIDATTWACEFSIPRNLLVNGDGGTSKSSGLPLASLALGSQRWYGHIGYQSPFAGPNGRVPLYAAARGDGFGDLAIEFDVTDLFPITAAAGWELYR